jgi:hypothetical protein
MLSNYVYFFCIDNSLPSAYAEGFVFWIIIAKVGGIYLNPRLVIGKLEEVAAGLVTVNPRGAADEPAEDGCYYCC